MFWKRKTENKIYTSKKQKRQRKIPLLNSLDAHNKTSDKNKKPSGVWTQNLIDELEWRVFEKLCIKLWQRKGYLAKETTAGADGGVDFYLYSPSSKTKIGAIQCKSWGKRKINVKVLRELQGVVASEGLKIGILMYSGKLTQDATEFLSKTNVSIKHQGSSDILKKINDLPINDQKKLLAEVTKGDYKTPSCPKCDIKLVKRTRKKDATEFWGCSHFPRCRYVLNMSTQNQ